MIKLKECRNVKCYNKFNPHLTRKQREFCCDKCAQKHYLLRSRVMRLYMSGTMYKAIAGILKVNMHQLFQLMNEDLPYTSSVRMNFKMDKRIASEEFLINTKYFYLQEADRIQPIPDQGQTIKEYINQNQKS